MTDSNSLGSIADRARQTLDRLRHELLDERVEAGHWVGELSPSSLSTATAVSAMSAVLLHGGDDENLRDPIARGIGYLRQHQNHDGGFGDTDRSHSNIATSYLVLAASTLAGESIGQSLEPSQVERLNGYIETQGELDGLRRRYGKDKTFVVPILTNMAIAGLVDWSQVAPLPFEAAVFPQSMYRFLGMPVVSYAIPALVAIGQARHFRRPSLPPLRWVRQASVNPTLKVLRRMQPESGGYLEATPLTAFVVMSLASTGRGDIEVAKEGLKFLVDSMTDQGSWPIDTNLATWVTSLAIHALTSDPKDDGDWCDRALIDWHLSCQHLQRHPFTGAEPGGWGWSDLSGAVPDSDDTPAAILALSRVARHCDDSTKAKIEKACETGKRWLLRLQNRDGGWPTFCRGWGKLPFDRSSTDLTGHAIRALCRGDAPADADVTKAVARGRKFLVRQQQPDGSWLPLWFGNQDREDESNPIYGTSRVLVASESVGLPKESRCRGRDFLISAQNADGGWGGGPSVGPWLVREGLKDRDSAVSSVEETALAVDALASVLLSESRESPERNLTTRGGVQSGLAERAMFDDENGRSVVDDAGGGTKATQVAIIRGTEFLLESVDDGRHRVPWPIGFYFAKLWYHERLYPVIFTATALGRYLQAVSDERSRSASKSDATNEVTRGTRFVDRT